MMFGVVFYGWYSTMRVSKPIEYLAFIDCRVKACTLGVCFCSHHVFDWCVLLLARGQSDVLR